MPATAVLVGGRAGALRAWGVKCGSPVDGVTCGLCGCGRATGSATWGKVRSAELPSCEYDVLGDEMEGFDDRLPARQSGREGGVFPVRIASDTSMA